MKTTDSLWGRETFLQLNNENYYLVKVYLKENQYFVFQEENLENMRMKLREVFDVKDERAAEQLKHRASIIPTEHFLLNHLKIATNKQSEEERLNFEK